MPVYLTSRKLLEAFGLDQLVEDRLLALAGEGDALVAALDALLDPALLGRIGDVHELDAERRAIGPPEDVDHLRDGRELQPEHVVDEDLPAVVGLGEAVGGGIELGFRSRRLELERVEMGVEMAAHAVGADHHDGADGIARRLLHGAVADLDAAGAEPGLDLLAELGGDPAPVAVERGDQLAIGDRPASPAAAIAARAASAATLAGSSLRPSKKARQSASTDAGSRA